VLADVGLGGSNMHVDGTSCGTCISCLQVPAALYRSC
jgi:hypothetical protein